MGGCKCAFYHCKNNTLLAKETGSIHSHFFHFPVKDEQRCIEWAVYSNNMECLKLPMDKLKNKVICDKHFPETCFMNYTRSKLNKTTSIPTIYFDPDNVEIDLLETPTEWVIENRKIMPDSGFLTSSIKPKIDIDETSPSQQITILNSSYTIQPVNAVKRMKLEIPTKPEVRILNKNPPISLKNSSSNQAISLKEAIKKSNQNNAKRIENSKLTNTPKILKHEIITSTQSPPSVINNEGHNYDLFTFLPEVSASSTQLPTIANNKNSNNKPVITIPHESLQEMKTVVKDIAEIKTMLNEKIQQVIQTPSTSSINANDSSNITQSHLNKIQLFNGIKRYLSPSLIALLRMEIFAAPNREYKKDEKIICNEILKLGEDVYDFFSDEWRLRLPSKQQVKEWQEDDALIDDDAS